MKILKNELKNELNIRTEKDFPQKGIEFIDIMPLIIQKETFNEIIELKNEYESSDNVIEFNQKALNIMIEKKVITKENAQKLIDKGKIKNVTI